MEGLLLEAVAREQDAERARRAAAARRARVARRRPGRGPVARILAGAIAFWHPHG